MARPSPLGTPAWASRLSPPPPARFAKERKLRIWRDYVAPTANLDQKDKQFVAKVSGWQSGRRGRRGLPAWGQRAGCPAAHAALCVCWDRPRRVLPLLPPCHGPRGETVRAQAGISGRPGVGRGETKRGEGKGPGCVGKGWWVPWGLVAWCRRDSLALPAAFLPAEGCLPSAEFSFPLLPAFPAPCPGTSPTAAPAPIPAGCWCGAVGSPWGRPPGWHLPAVAGPAPGPR